MKITRSKLFQIIKEEIDNLNSPQSSSASVVRKTFEDSGELEELVMEAELGQLVAALSEADLPEAEETQLKEAMFNAMASLNDADVVKVFTMLKTGN